MRAVVGGEILRVTIELLLTFMVPGAVGILSCNLLFSGFFNLEIFKFSSRQKWISKVEKP